MWIKKNLAYILLVLVVTIGCKPKSEYEKMVRKELSSGIRNDSLFLGISLGMERKAFFAHCWELNKQHLIKQGPSNLSVEYEVDSMVNLPMFMRFYPNFRDKEIYEMPVEFYYKSWAAWNAETKSDSLLADVKQLMERWYGDGFILMGEESAPNRIWVKVDGNRRITISINSMQSVRVVLTDLLAYNEILKERRKESQNEEN